METLYRRIEIKEGNSTEPVQYVGVYTLNWQREWGEPEVAFTEEEPPSQEQVTVDEINELIQPHAITLEHGEKAAQDVHDLVHSKEAKPVGEEKNCKWTYDEDHCYYDTNCGKSYGLIDGTLKENSHIYCPYCGGKIRELNNG